MSSLHLVIAGTGRAGSSFLVQFLHECGLETAVEDSEWHPRARAGGESTLDPDADLPYVVKDPWLWTYCRSLDLDRLRIEALVVPVRDLTSAAASRVLQERVALAETPWVDRRDLGVYGALPGGVIYSLSIVDQARILAVGFHELLRWAVSNNIPTVLVDFPRIVDDGEYLVSSLWPFLDGRINREAALEAFGRVADSHAVRLRSQADEPTTFAAFGSPHDEMVDRAALAIRVGELRANAEDARERLTAVEVELAEVREREARLLAELAEVSTTATTVSDDPTAVRATRSWLTTRALRAIRRHL